MSLARLEARVAALQAGSQLPAPPSDPVILTSNLLALVSGTVPAGLPPKRAQFFEAPEQSEAGRVVQVRDAVPLDVGNATNIAWERTTDVMQSGTLA